MEDRLTHPPKRVEEKAKFKLEKLMSSALNMYGDQCSVLSTNKGADIATQRADDLDIASVEYAKKHPGSKALDFGCGAGGQAARLAGAGVNVVGLDMAPLAAAFTEHLTQQALLLGYTGEHDFYACDMLAIPEEWLTAVRGSFSQITCQRAIHYIPRHEAIRVLNQLHSILQDDGKLFISCSGLHSELGNGYEGKTTEPTDRFGYLSQEMQNKHQIKQPVCLYDETEFADMLACAGWRIDTIYSSAFGNIKVIASKA